jgi:hypothetical protein
MEFPVRQHLIVVSKQYQLLTSNNYNYGNQEIKPRRP